MAGVIFSLETNAQFPITFSSPVFLALLLFQLQLTQTQYIKIMQNILRCSFLLHFLPMLLFKTIFIVPFRGKESENCEKTENMHNVLFWVCLLLLCLLSLMASPLRTVSHTHARVSCANLQGTDFIWYGSSDSKAAASSCHQHIWLHIS